jgi:hypothetical protein
MEHLHVFVTSAARGLCDDCADVCDPGLVCCTCKHRRCERCGAGGYLAVPECDFIAIKQAAR